jgi:alcohol dehydrogenase (NADP+)
VYSARSATSALAPGSIQRRAPRPQDIQIEILYCGVCHSDLHTVRNEWESVMPTVYPCVPGHEIVGRVVKVGSAVQKFKEGDIAAVGCLVDSCGVCPGCRAGEEQFCDGPATFTYNGEDKQLGGVTYGGYSDSIVVTEKFVLRVSKDLDLAAAAPLLCAGITTYSPLRHWNVKKGQKVGIVGLGGLGHMGLKFAHAFGANVVLFTTSPNKTEDAVRLGADEVVISKNDAEMQKHAGSFDFILDTVSASHDLNAYLNLLKRDATMTLVGAPPNPVAGSGLPPDFQAAAVRRLPDRRYARDAGDARFLRRTWDYLRRRALIRIQQINEAYERLLKSDVKYRFVVDMASLK